MPLLNTLARLEAVRAGRAQALATVRHRHLGERPLVVVPLTTAGEAGAPLGALVGTDPAAPTLLVVPQPRDRDLRWTFLAELADQVLPYVDGYADDVELVERNETDPETGAKSKVAAELCLDAPQLIVPSRAGVEYVRLLGRSMRFRRTAEEDPENPYPAPPGAAAGALVHTPRGAGTGARFLDAAVGDGAARSALGDGPEQSGGPAPGRPARLDRTAGGESGAEAALRVEVARDPRGGLLVPPAGPATDPAFDNRLLAPAMAGYDAARASGDPAAVERAEREVRELVADQMRPTWAAVWRALELVRALPAGERTEERWTRDRWSYTGHRDRVRAGEPPQPRRDDAVTAAQKLATRETEQVRLDAQEALDDPLVMAGRRLSGEAFAGEVTEVVMEWTQAKRPRPRPLVTVDTEDRPQLADGGGGKVFRSLDGRPQAAEFVRFEDAGRIVLRLLDKMGGGREPVPGSVPEKGDRLCWTLFEHDARGGPRLPDPEKTPWTHGGPPAHLSADRPHLPAPDPVTAEDLL